MDDRQQDRVGILDRLVSKSKHGDFQNRRFLRIVMRIGRRHFPKQNATPVLVVIAERPELAPTFLNIPRRSLVVRLQHSRRQPDVTLPVGVILEPVRVRVALDQRYDH